MAHYEIVSQHSYQTSKFLCDRNFKTSSVKPCLTIVKTYYIILHVPAQFSKSCFGVGTCYVIFSLYRVPSFYNFYKLNIYRH